MDGISSPPATLLILPHACTPPPRLTATLTSLFQSLVALHDLWKKTKGSLSLDLKRRQWKSGVPGRDSLWRVYPPTAAAAEPGAVGRRRRWAGVVLACCLGLCRAAYSPGASPACCA